MEYPKMLTRDKTRVMNIIETTPTSKNKHYKIRLLQKTYNPKLPMNKKFAENRLVLLEKRLERNPVLGKRQEETVNPYISKAYVRKLTQNEIRNTSDITNFVPHHCVLKPKKPDKTRTVFDTGTKCKGVSVNDNLLKGPDLLNSLVTT